MTERLLLGLALLALALLLGLGVKLLPLLWRLYVRHAAGETYTFARNDGRRTLLYFYTERCVDCRTRQEPALAALLGQHPGHFALARVNALQEAALARHFRVLTVPSTVVLDEEGRVVDANLGFAPARRLAAQLGLESAGAPARALPESEAAGP